MRETPRESLRPALAAVVAHLPDDASVTLPVRWIRERLEEAEPPASDELLTVGEMASMAKVSRSTVRTWLRAGLVPGAYRLGASWRARASEFRTWCFADPPPASSSAEPSSLRRSRRRAGVHRGRLSAWRDVVRPDGARG